MRLLELLRLAGLRYQLDLAKKYNSLRPETTDPSELREVMDGKTLYERTVNHDQGMTPGHEADDGRASDPDPRRSKVGRLIAEHDLEGMGRRLEGRWTGESGEKHSLRDLADFFNQHLLRAVMEDAGRRPLDGEIENLYRLLTDEAVSGGVRTEARHSLERDGIDVDALESSFVSHQAIHTYLTKYRGASHDAEDRDQLEKDRETVRRLVSRTATVTESTLERLRDTDRVTLGDFDVLVDLRVLCSDCGAAFDVTELLDAGGCECER